MAQKAGNTTCTMIFNGQDRDVGWTESFQSSTVSLDTAMASLERVARARVGLLSARYEIQYLRISAVQAPKVPPARNQRIAYLKRFSGGGSLDPSGDGDLPFVAALCRFYNADKTVFALREFRGLPDRFWTNNEDKGAQATLVQPIAALINALVAANMGIDHKNPTPPGGVTLVTIASGEYQRLTHRITGRPLYLSRGRRSNRPA